MQSLSGEPLFSLNAEPSWTCDVLKEMAKKAVRDLPVTGRLGALLLDGQALAGEQNLEEVGLVNGSAIMAVVVPLTFSAENSDPRISVDEDGRFLRLSDGVGGGHMYPAACGPALKLGEIHYFEVKLLPMTPAHARSASAFAWDYVASIPHTTWEKTRSRGAFGSMMEMLTILEPASASES